VLVDLPLHRLDIFLVARIAVAIVFVISGAKVFVIFFFADNDEIDKLVAAALDIGERRILPDRFAGDDKMVRVWQRRPGYSAKTFPSVWRI
jgi:hypothetical protein